MCGDKDKVPCRRGKARKGDCIVEKKRVDDAGGHQGIGRENVERRIRSCQPGTDVGSRKADAAGRSKGGYKPATSFIFFRVDANSGANTKEEGTFIR